MPCVGVNNILTGFFLLNMFVQQHNNVPVHWFRRLVSLDMVTEKSLDRSIFCMESIKHTIKMTQKQKETHVRYIHT